VPITTHAATDLLWKMAGVGSSAGGPDFSNSLTASSRVLL
jgi:hypothetical protein